MSKSDGGCCCAPSVLDPKLVQQTEVLYLNDSNNLMISHIQMLNDKHMKIEIHMDE